jgi:hypothetical protein
MDIDGEHENSDAFIDAFQRKDEEVDSAWK